MSFITKEINGLHYSYYPEDLGHDGYTAVCDETGDQVILALDNDGNFTGEVIAEDF